MTTIHNDRGSLVCGDGGVTVIAHTHWDLKSHWREGGLVVRARRTHCPTTLATVVLEREEREEKRGEERRERRKKRGRGGRYYTW